MRRMYSKPQLLEAVEQEAKVNGLKAFENIVDKDGHKRFIEGDLNLYQNVPNTWTKTYGKWSLSGSHLLIVLGITIPDESASFDGVLCALGGVLPQWIIDKIYTLFSNVVIRQQIPAYANNFTSQNCIFLLEKISDENLRIYASTPAMTADRNVRIAFDLLIDNE